MSKLIHNYPNLNHKCSLQHKPMLNPMFKHLTIVMITANAHRWHQIRNQLKVLIKVGSVDFQRDDSQGNPVLAYLQRRGMPRGLTTPLANEYTQR